jgi:beta-glucosidase-like glycosyl hydrolase
VARARAVAGRSHVQLQFCKFGLSALLPSDSPVGRLICACELVADLPLQRPLQVPACANSEIMTRKMRHTWGFTGSIVSDDGAIKQLTNCTKNHTERCPDGSMTGGHGFAATLPEAAADALKAGCDVDYGVTFASPAWGLPAALRKGLATEDDVRAAVRRSLSTRFILGEYDRDVKDNPGLNPWNALHANATVNCEGHRRLAQRAAEQSMVLVLNDESPSGRGLPLVTGVRRLAILGAAANSSSAINGRYTGQPELSSVSTLLKGLEERAAANTPAVAVVYALNDTAVASDADAVIVVVQSHVESESHDRASLKMRPEDAATLMRLQTQLGAETKVQVVVVVVSGECPLRGPCCCVLCAVTALCVG